MLSEFSAGSLRIVFGAGSPSLELAGTAVLVTGIVGYAIRLVYYSLSSVRQTEDGTTSSDRDDPTDATYTGPYCAG